MSQSLILLPQVSGANSPVYFKPRPHRTNFGWSDFRTTWALDLWSRGYAAGHIARRLRVSRNAVLSKVFDSSVLVGDTWKRATEAFPHARFTREKLKWSASSFFPARSIYFPRSPLSAEALIPGGCEDDHACSWPIGDPCLPGFHFCGGRRLPGKSYCAVHAPMARGGVL